MLILGFEDQRKMASVAVTVHQVRTFQSASCHGCPAGRAQWVQESGGRLEPSRSLADADSARGTTLLRRGTAICLFASGRKCSGGP